MSNPMYANAMAEAAAKIPNQPNAWPSPTKIPSTVAGAVSSGFGGT